MILTALVQYVNVHKDEQLSIKGQICLMAYFACHSISRITATAAIFAKPRQLERPEDSPVVPHLAAGIIGIILFTGQIILIYVYKYQHINAFRETSITEKIVHVLANTLCVIPFRPGIQYDNIKESVHVDNALQTICCSTQDKLASNRESVHNINDAGNYTDAVVELKNELDPLHKTIENIWWEDPKRTLNIKDITDIMEKDLKEDNESHEDDENRTEGVFKYLVNNGYINKTLQNPRQTKQEYVWLFTIHLFIHLVSLSFEFLNGGISTEKGVYVSWDIRIITFLLGLFFLRLYYDTIYIIKSKRPSTPFLKRLKNIRDILCCKEKENVIQSIPKNLVLSPITEEEEVDCLKTDVVPGKRTLETQTSIYEINITKRKKDDGAAIGFIDE